jgi:hypothetical protein
LVVVPLTILAPLAFGNHNAFTSLPINDTTEQTSTPARVSATEVLWDLTHGIYLDYSPSGTYAPLVSQLVDYNFSVTDAGIDNVNLSMYNILVICAGSAWDSPYSPAEVAAAEAYAASGGAILILGDNADTPEGNINPLSEAFGVTTGLNVVFPLDLYFSNFAPHPLFDGIGQLYFRSAGGLAVAAPSQAVAWTDDGSDITIALSESPCVVTLGDINVFAEYLSSVDNSAFASNVFNWLRDCGSATAMEPKTWGAIKASFHSGR